MHPELFSIDNFTVHTYGFMIMLGALLSYLFITRSAKRELGIDPDKIQTLAIYVILSAFLGGKLFFYFEDPKFYFHPPSNMLQDFRTGFVFYGSLLFAVPIAFWFFKKEKWPLWPMMDLLAITILIIHTSGRLGCFSAGCCYGLPTNAPWGISFTNELSQAEPLHTSLHPTQLYEAVFLGLLIIFLIMFKRHKRFEGQLFMIYLMVYSVGRGMIEIFRGDLRRGFIIEDFLSHSQLISLFIICFALWMYRKLRKKGLRVKKG